MRRFVPALALMLVATTAAVAGETVSITLPPESIALKAGPGMDQAQTAKDAGAATINYGLFLNTVINFLLVAFALFFVVKAMNTLYRTPPAAPTEKDCQYCATRIPVRATRCPHCTSAVA